MADDARLARQSRNAHRIAIISIIVYNIVGIMDIFSTAIAIEMGVAEEANPIVAMAMDKIGTGWIAAKLFLQGVISFMVLWFPHWIVLSMFTVATTMNAFVVYNNLVIGGFL